MTEYHIDNQGDEDVAYESKSLIDFLKSGSLVLYESEDLTLGVHLDEP